MKIHASSEDFSKPSVSIAMKKLLENGLITISDDSNIDLTDKGLEIAQSIYERHEVISNMLISIGVNEEIARKDACKIEHDLSEESFQALKNYYLKK